MKKHLLTILLTLCWVVGFAQAPNVMILAADNQTWANEVKSKLQATGLLGTIDVVDASNTTPTLAQMQAYKAIFTWSDFGYANGTALGNNLASYVDGGGGLVVAVFANASIPLGGNINTSTYQVLVPASQTQFTQLSMGTVVLPSHPIMLGVTSFNGGSGSWKSTSTTLTSGSYTIANWSNGHPLIMAKDNVGPMNARRVDLNFFPPSSDSRSDFWQASTSGARIMANSLLYVAGGATALHFNGWGNTNPTGSNIGLSTYDYITVPDNGTMDLGNTYTIESWVYLDDNQNNTIIDKGSYRYLFQTHPNGNSGLGLYNTSMGWKYSAGTVPTNQWVHVAVTFNANTGTVVFYLNGNVLSTHTSGISTPGPDNGIITIGRQDPAGCQCNNFDGRMDELRVWNRALAQCEIVERMNCELNPSAQTGLAALYRFNQGAINANNSSITTAVDASGNGNNGTLVNFALTGTTSNWAVGTLTTACTTPPPATASITAGGTTTFCQGGSVLLTANSGPGQTYQWKLNGNNIGGATNISYTANVSGNYTVEVTKTACSTTTVATSSPIVVTVNPLPTTYNVIGGGTYCTGGAGIAVGLSGSQTGVNYQLKRNGVNTGSIIGGTGGTLSFGNQTLAGVYTVVATNPSTNCTSNMTGSVAVNIYAPEINVTGNSNSITDGDNTPSATDATDFGGTLPSVAVTKTYTIENTGTDSLDITTINITGTDANNFTVGGIILPVTINPSSSVTFTVTFSTVAIGIKNAAVEISSSDCDEATYDYAIQGEITCAPASFTTCPTNISITAANGQCSNVATYTTTTSGTPSPVVTYSFSGATTGSGSGDGSGSTFNVGVTTVTINATNACSNVNCMFTVTVTDNQAPVLTGVPANATVSCDNVPAPASVTAGDNCSSTLPVSYSQIITSGALPPSGLKGYWNFNEGSGTSTADQTSNGNNGTLTSGVNWITGQSGSAVQFPGTSNSYVSIPNTTNGALDTRYSISMFAWYWPGSNGSQQNPIIQYNANGWGTHMWQTGSNQLFVRFTARNTLAFTNNLAANTLIPNQWNCVGATYDYNTGIARLWCNGVNVQTLNIGVMELSTNYPVRVGSVDFDSRRTNSKVDNVAIYDRALNPTEIAQLCAVTCPQNYTITRTWSATDAANNTTTASQTITVRDTDAPVVTTPAPITVNNTVGTCGAVVNFQATATDNCSNNITLTYSQNPGTVFPVGTTIVTATATDECGNRTNGYISVTVTDNENPVITAPANIAVNNDAGICGAVVTYSTPVGTDNCSGATTVQTAGLSSGSTFPVGTTINTFVVTDAYNNTATTSFTVTVTDNENPVIAAPANISVNNDAGICGAVVTYSTPVGTDNCSGATTVQTAGLPSGSTFPVGTTTNTFVVTDANYNTDTASFTVTVTDNENPVIIAPANIAVNNDEGVCGAVVTYSTPVGTDNCSGATTVQTAGLPSGSTFPIGTTSNTFVVTDANNNTDTASFTVTVTDNENPVITTPANIAVNNDTGICGAVVTYSTPVGTDNCSGATTVQTAGLPSGSTFPVGVTTNTFVVTDANNNTATASFTVTVTDNEAPIAVCQNYTLNLSGGTGTITTANINNGSTDNCGIASMSLSKTSFNCTNAGANTVTLTVTDIHGNSSTCTATVTVQYRPTCNIAVTPSNTTYTGGVATNIYLGYGPQSATITCNATGGTGFTYSWSPSANLSCTNCQSPVFTPTTPGNYTFTVTATNSNGCSTTCTVTFCVLDVRVPGQNNKVYLCHVPPGNPGNAQTLSISVNAVPAHLSGHAGDRLGMCSQVICGSLKGTETAGSGIIHSDEFKIYPNPTSGVFKVEIPHDVKVDKIVVMDVTGKVVATKVNVEGNTTFELGDVARGVYMVNIMYGTEVHRTKLTVQ